MQYNLPSASSSLNSYLNYIDTIPLLSIEEEMELIEKTQQQQCRQSAQKLVLHNLRFVVFTAKRFEHYGLPLQDLIQEGNIALMLSIKKFQLNYQKTCRLVSFAAMHIASAMMVFINKNLKIFKLATTKGVRKALNHLGKYEKVGEKYLSNQTIATIAQDLNITEQDVRDAYERRLSAPVMISGINNSDDDIDTIEHELTDDRYNPHTLVEQYTLQTIEKKQMQHAISQLNERHSFLLQNRWLTDQPMTLKQISEMWGISQEAVRQNELRMLEKLKQALEMQ